MVTSIIAEVAGGGRPVRALLVAALIGAPASAAAQPLRLRGDALARLESPVGLVSLEGDDRLRPWLTAEALVWVGGGDEDEANAMVVAVRLRDPRRRAVARLGRFVVTAGALPPLHLDGAAGVARLPRGFRVEAFGGVPVAPGDQGRSVDWAVGGRLARGLGDFGSAGLAYYHRRDHGALSDEVIGADAAAALGEQGDAAVRVSWDLVDPGLAEAHLSTGLRRKAWRGELFASHRSPGRLLPATSLFSVLGDMPSQLVGSSARWRAAPRLDLDGVAGARFIDGEPAAHALARATLRLDDRGGGALAVELRRDGAPMDSWTGLRGTARVPLARRWTAAAEAEAAVPDHGGGDRGRLWLWGLAALTWSPAGWDVAAAVEASRDPEHLGRVDVLARAGRRWGGP